MAFTGFLLLPAWLVWLAMHLRDYTPPEGRRPLAEGNEQDTINASGLPPAQPQPSGGYKDGAGVM